MILVEGTAQCPHCNRQHWIPTDLAAKFNNRLYPDNPEVWRQRPNAEEAN